MRINAIEASVCSRVPRHGPNRRRSQFDPVAIGSGHGTSGDVQSLHERGAGRALEVATVYYKRSGILPVRRSSGAGKIAAAICFAMAFLAAGPAAAYMGPGAGLSAIGTLLALVAALCLAIVGFVWYPLKRVFRKTGASAPPRAQRRDDGAER
jgi:hypothetical protein